MAQPLRSLAFIPALHAVRAHSDVLVAHLRQVRRASRHAALECVWAHQVVSVDLVPAHPQIDSNRVQSSPCVTRLDEGKLASCACSLLTCQSPLRRRLNRVRSLGQAVWIRPPTSTPSNAACGPQIQVTFRCGIQSKLRAGPCSLSSALKPVLAQPTRPE
jgi:hypothetical protein